MHGHPLVLPGRTGSRASRLVFEPAGQETWERCGTVDLAAAVNAFVEEVSSHFGAWKLGGIRAETIPR